MYIDLKSSAHLKDGQVEEVRHGRRHHVSPQCAVVVGHVNTSHGVVVHVTSGEWSKQCIDVIVKLYQRYAKVKARDEKMRFLIHEKEDTYRNKFIIIYIYLFYFLSHLFY